MSAKIAIEGATRADSWMVPPESLVIKGLDDQDTDHYLYQRERTAAPIDDAKVEYVMANGITSDVMVQRDGDSWIVVDGRQRIKAARLANERLIAKGAQPVMVRIRVYKGDEVGAMGAMITANTFRNEDMYADNAETARRLMEVHNKPAEYVAKLFAVDPATVKRMVRFSELAAPVKRAVRDGEITISAALALLPLPRAEQADKVKEIVRVAEEETAQKEAKRAAKKKPSKKPAAAKPAKKKKAAGAKAAKKVVAADKGSHVAPGRKEIRAYLDSLPAVDAALDDVKAVLRWVLGDGPAPSTT
jgi:ParB family chromosome partitioning protein